MLPNELYDWIDKNICSIIDNKDLKKIPEKNIKLLNTLISIKKKLISVDI